MTRMRQLGFWAGLLAVVGACILSRTLDWSDSKWSPETVCLAGVTIWMAVWWVSETVHLAVTGFRWWLFPCWALRMPKPFLLPMRTGSSCCSWVGFRGPRSEKWDLHKRIALTVMSRIGTKPRTLVLSFMATTAILSMWISNWPPR